MQKRLCLFLLAALLCLPLLAGCVGGDPSADTAPPATEPDTPAASLPETLPESNPLPEETAGADTAATSEDETDPLPPPDLGLVQDGTYLCTLVWPEKTTGAVSVAGKHLGEAMAARFGSSFSGTNDKVSEDVTPGTYEIDRCEILLGETNRRESLEVYLTLEAGQYAIRVVGNKLVIIGYTDALTAEAAEAFMRDTVTASDQSSLILPGDYAVKASPYAENEAEAGPAFEAVEPTGDALHAEAMQWMACELTFVSATAYEDPVYTVDTDVIFRHRESGTTLSVPAFWDGGTTWRVRFAPTEVGEWEFYTVCTDAANSGLHHRTGTVTCTPYTGELAIYRHGFVKTEPGKPYFMHADGTPFFYLADTHFTLALEELDSYGSIETQKNAGITAEEAAAAGVSSQFRYIMDYRAAQGYTVIQSQPLGWWTNPGQNGWFADTEQNIFTYGVNDIMLAKFQQYDQYFAYIAELGMVHTNTQFGYPTALMTEYFAGNITDTELEKLCRYWVARYSAYPVMWSTTQEGDNDYYGDRGDCAATPETNPWLKVMTYVVDHDPYKHPTTCHQEHWGHTTVSNSSFGKLPGHTWYGAQYNTPLNNPLDWGRLREYWNNPGSKPVVNYEGRYDHFWTGTEGARAQGWIAFMNGQVGYGYGVQPIWNIFWSGNGISNWTSSDENGAFNLDDNWLEGLQSEGGEQVTYIKDFLTQYEWWRMAPCFDASYFYQPGRYRHSVAHIGNTVFLGYFYGTHKSNEKLGTLTNMANGEYEVVWMNCRTGEYTELPNVTVTDGTYDLPPRPGDEDWVIAVKKVG